MTFSLNISISAADLNQIMMTGNKVQIYSMTETGTNVAWLTFSPMMQNTINWTEDYQIYVSTTQIQNGAVIMVMDAANAKPQQQYIWTGSNFMVQPAPSLGSTQFMLTNNGTMPAPHATMGLSKQGVVNGRQTGYTPVNAIAVLTNSNSLTGYTTQVYVALGTGQNGTVTTNLPHGGCYVNYNNGATSMNVQYSNGQFFVV